MSLWICPTHGLYGGDVFCPTCGGTGTYATFPPAQGTEAAPAAETPKSGSVHDGPVLEEDAPHG